MVAKNYDVSAFDDPATVDCRELPVVRASMFCAPLVSASAAWPQRRQQNFSPTLFSTDTDPQMGHSLEVLRGLTEAR